MLISDNAEYNFTERLGRIYVIWMFVTLSLKIQLSYQVLLHTQTGVRHFELCVCLL